MSGLRTAVPRIQLGHALYQVVFDGRQRPLQFSEDCGGFDLLGTLSLSHAGICLLDDQVETGPHYALFFQEKVETCCDCIYAMLVAPIGAAAPQCLAGSPQQGSYTDRDTYLPFLQRK